MQYCPLTPSSSSSSTSRGLHITGIYKYSFLFYCPTIVQIVTLVNQWMEEIPASSENTCPICLLKFADRSLMFPCFHAFCFNCICTWFQSIAPSANSASISRACPMCKQSVAYGIHRIVDTTTYSIHRFDNRNDNQESGYHFDYEQSKLRRMMVYRFSVWCKHIGSNFHSRYRPFPRLQRNGIDNQEHSLMDHRLKMWLAREVIAVSLVLDAGAIITYISGIMNIR